MSSSGLSPLEILDQADDDERLLAALEGLTLESGPEEDSSASSTFGDHKQASQAELQNEGSAAGEEPSREHGTRSEFIKDVSERLITRVNTEAANIDQAKQLMHQYMVEFCAEYDRCGYSSGTAASKASQDGSSPSASARSENLQQSWTDRTSSSTASATAGDQQKKTSGQ